MAVPRRRRINAQPKPHANAEVVPEGERPCPICGEAMETATEKGLKVDVCEDHGVWLDAGELETMVRRVAARERGRGVSRAKAADRSGRMKGAVFGWWSLLLE